MTGESVTAALGTVKELVSWVVEFIAGNSVLMVFFVAGMIPVAVMVFKKLRKSVSS